MSAIEYTQSTQAQAGLYRIVRRSGAHLLWVSHSAGDAPRKVYVSARFSESDIKHWMGQHARVLVMPIAQGEHADVFGVAIDFVLLAPPAPQLAPKVLDVDEIRFAQGAGRIFWHADALYIAAQNIESKARFIHRITGGSIKIG